MTKKTKKTKWLGKIIYPNGFFRSGVVKNNIPPHDVIRFQFYREKKDGVQINNEDVEMAVDEALALAFLLIKAVLFYIFDSPENIRSWEYKDKIKTSRIIKKNNDQKEKEY